MARTFRFLREKPTATRLDIVPFVAIYFIIGYLLMVSRPTNPEHHRLFRLRRPRSRSPSQTPQTHHTARVYLRGRPLHQVHAAADLLHPRDGLPDRQLEHQLEALPTLLAGLQDRGLRPRHDRGPEKGRLFLRGHLSQGGRPGGRRGLLRVLEEEV